MSNVVAILNECLFSRVCFEYRSGCCFLCVNVFRTILLDHRDIVCSTHDRGDMSSVPCVWSLRLLKSQSPTPEHELFFLFC